MYSSQFAKAFKRKFAAARSSGGLEAHRPLLIFSRNPLPARASFKAPCSTAQMHFAHSKAGQQPQLPSSPQSVQSHHPCAAAEDFTSAAMHATVPSPLKRPRPSTLEYIPHFYADPHSAPHMQVAPQHAAIHPLAHTSPHPFAHAAPKTVGGANLYKALKSVVKVFSTIACPNFATPWQMHQQSKSTASGFILHPLSERRILTNAHAVANQIQVQLRKHGNAKKFSAKVLATGHECDIALLTVQDDEFWEGVQGLEIGGLPHMQESVVVVGYPTGGENICVTKGVISRVDRQLYSHGRTSLLALQIDAAINSGNSGGPVIMGDKVIGLAFQCLTVGENIGYVIPVPVMRHFLRDLKINGRYTGFCELGVGWQTLESIDLKLAARMPSHETGVYVTALEPCYHAAKVLKEGDVITHFNGHSIADDGTFLFDFHAHNITTPGPLAPDSALPKPPGPSDPAPAALTTHPSHHDTNQTATSPMVLGDDSEGLSPHLQLQTQPPHHQMESLSLGLPLAPAPTAASTIKSSDSNTEQAAPANNRDHPLVQHPSHPLASLSSQQQQQQGSGIGGGTAHSPLSPRKIPPRAASAASTPTRHHGHTHAAVAPSPKAPQPPSALQSYLSQQSQQAQKQGAHGSNVLAVQPNLASFKLSMMDPAMHQTARIDFRHLVAMNYAGDMCTLGVWRDGAAIPGGVLVQLSAPKQLVPVHSHDAKPQYFIFGGFVFTKLTNFYLRSTYGMDWTHKAPIKLCDRSFAGTVEAEGQECVVLSKVLAWPEVNTGYQDLGNVEVLKCCGVQVHNLAHLAHLLKNARGPYVRLDLQWNKVVVINREKAESCEEIILEQNSILNPYFPKDLLRRNMMLPEELKMETEAALAKME